MNKHSATYYPSTEKFQGNPTYTDFLGLNNFLNNNKSELLNSLDKLNIAFLRNYTVEPILPILSGEMFFSNFSVDYYLNDYDTIAKEVFDSNSELYRFNPDVIFLSQWLTNVSEKATKMLFRMSAKEKEEEIDRIISQTHLFLSNIRKYTSAPIIFNNFPRTEFLTLGIIDNRLPQSEAHWYNKLNQKLLELSFDIADSYCLDFNVIFNTIGVKEALDQKKWESVKAPLTFKSMLALAKEYGKFIRALKGKTKKCLVLDCDNTLWGGIVGEEGLSGIKLGGTYPGSSFQSFQEKILNLKHRGVILALCSKNNEEDVLAVFEKNDQMKLSLNDISCHRINWKDKATNIKEIAQELNIGTESIVFVDDSKFECEWVSTNLPEVTTIHLNTEPAYHANKVFNEGFFDSLNFLEEDSQKTERYKAEEKRKALSKQASSYEDYLESLELEANIEPLTRQTVERVAQLTQKTNQFNLTTKRYTADQIGQLIDKKGYSVFTMEAKDKVAKLGIIAAAIIHQESKSAVLDSFMMSCRALGRGLENAFLSFILDDLKEKGVNRVTGIYLPTKKNKQTQDFFKQNNFRKIKQTDNEIKWEFNFQEDQMNASPKWINIK